MYKILAKEMLLPDVFLLLTVLKNGFVIGQLERKRFQIVVLFVNAYLCGKRPFSILELVTDDMLYCLNAVCTMDTTKFTIYATICMKDILRSSI